jgi:hypothetical protein
MSTITLRREDVMHLIDVAASCVGALQGVADSAHLGAASKVRGYAVALEDALCRLARQIDALDGDAQGAA